MRPPNRRAARPRGPTLAAGAVGSGTERGGRKCALRDADLVAQRVGKLAQHRALGEDALVGVLVLEGTAQPLAQGLGELADTHVLVQHLEAVVVHA